MIRAAIISPLALAACDTGSSPEAGVLPEYRGAETRMLDPTILAVAVEMSGPVAEADITAYARCVAARATREQDAGFARHLRTNLQEKGGVCSADAVYTISPSLPRGVAPIDAEVELAICAENGIPTGGGRRADVCSTPGGIAVLILAQVLAVVAFVMISLLFLVYGDRKIWAAAQMRRGPNVVGPMDAGGGE